MLHIIQPVEIILHDISRQSGWITQELTRVAGAGVRAAYCPGY